MKNDKKELVLAVSEIFGLEENIAREVCNEVFVYVLDRLAEGKEVTYSGFGTFFRRFVPSDNRYSVHFFAHDFAKSIINGKSPDKFTLFEE